MQSNSFTSSSKWVVIQVGAGIVLAIVALNIALHYVMQNLDTNGATASGLDSRQATDVLFIGDSRTNQGIDPRVFEEASGKQISALNLGRPGMQAPMFYFLTRDYLENSPTHPKAIVVNISFYLLGGRQWFEDIYLAYYNPQFWQVTDALDTQLINTDEALSWYFGTRIPMLRYRKRLAGLIDSFAEDPTRAAFREHARNSLIANLARDEKNKGYLSRGVSALSGVSENEFASYKVGIDNGYSVYTDYLKRFFDLAARYRIHVIVYAFPWPLQAKAAPNFQEVLAHYDNKIKSIAEGNPYVHFVEHDFYWNEKYFADPLHLNQQGAEVLSRRALEWVQPYVATK